MFGRKQRGTVDHVASRTVWCALPIDLNIPLRDKAIMAIAGLESVYKVEAGMRGGYYGLWIDFYRFRALASKPIDLAQIEEIMAELQRNYQAPSTTQ